VRVPDTADVTVVVFVDPARETTDFCVVGDASRTAVERDFTEPVAREFLVLSRETVVLVVRGVNTVVRFFSGTFVVATRDCVFSDFPARETAVPSRTAAFAKDVQTKIFAIKISNFFISDKILANL
jgi:hypothetical protein